MNKQAIGILDSGVGGLSIARAVHDTLPAEDLIYIADSKYAPYGNKSTSEINQRVSTLIELLKQKDIKVLVVACNTATVNLIAHLREKYSLPIIGVEPGVKPAAANTKSKKIGVLATEGTINSKAFLEFVGKFSAQNELMLTPCPKFVPLIEQAQIGTVSSMAAVEEYVKPLIEKGCDQIVLGCTHYPFLKKDIEQVASGQAQIIDTSQAVANQVKNVLTEHNLLNQQKKEGQAEFFTTGNTDFAHPLFSMLWQKPVAVRAILSPP